MKSKKQCRGIVKSWQVAMTGLLLSIPALADNPIVQTNYTADPAPMAYGDTLYVYTGHDEDGATYFEMLEWRVYSTTDMVNWTDRGSPLSYKTFSWSGGKAWAAQTIYRNGKFYWYVTAGIKGGDQPAIGVAVGNTPVGPFTDPIGKPLVSKSWDDIDPTAFIDDNGQAHLYWGNPKLYHVSLNTDMISYTGAVEVDPMTTASFGTRTGDANRKTTYEEGPWIFKRGEIYYMVYASGPISEKISYSTGTTAKGPWTYRGVIMDDNTGSFTNHSGIVEYKNKWYFFYHTGKLPGGGGFTRSVAVEAFNFNADGSIPKIPMTANGPSPIENFNPFRKVQAETMAFSRGLKVAQDAPTGVYVTKINNGDYIKLRSVDFTAAGADTIVVSAGCTGAGGTIEVHQDTTNGKLLGTVTVAGTGGATTWKQFKATLTGATGVKNLFLVFKGSGTADLFNFDYWEMISKNGPILTSSSQGSSSSAARSAYSSAAAIPGTVQMENYDNGGADVAYMDMDAINEGAKYRQDGVDIVDGENSGFAVGYILANEWLEYSVNVTTAGAQAFSARVAAGGEGGAFQLSIDGAPITESITVPTTTSWDTYQTITGATQSISAGPHVLRFTALGSYFNIDWLTFGGTTGILRAKESKNLSIFPGKRYNLLGQQNKH